MMLVVMPMIAFVFIFIIFFSLYRNRFISIAIIIIISSLLRTRAVAILGQARSPPLSRFPALDRPTGEAEGATARSENSRRAHAVLSDNRTRMQVTVHRT